jgi:hypothetical protein
MDYASDCKYLGKSCLVSNILISLEGKSLGDGTCTFDSAVLAVLAINLNQKASFILFSPLMSRLRSRLQCTLYRLPRRHRAEYRPLYAACDHPTPIFQVANHQSPAHSTITHNFFSSHLRPRVPNCPFSIPHLAKPSSNSPFNRS